MNRRSAIQWVAHATRRSFAWAVCAQAALTFVPHAAAHSGRSDEPEPRDEVPPGVPGPPETGLFPPPLLPLVPLAEVAGFDLATQPANGETELDEYFRDAAERERVEAGVVDGWFRELGRSMRRAFRPNMERAERERRAGMNLGERLIDELSRYAAGPTQPQDPPGTPPVEQQAAVGSAGSADEDEVRALMVWQEQINCLNAPVVWRRVEVATIHNPEGALSAVWLVRSSGMEVFDAAALSAVATAADSTRAPDPHLFDGVFALRSDWAFEAGYAATAVNVVCGVDGEDGPQVGASGRGIVRKRLELLRVRRQRPLPALDPRLRLHLFGRSRAGPIPPPSPVRVVPP